MTRLYGNRVPFLLHSDPLLPPAFTQWSIWLFCGLGDELIKMSLYRTRFNTFWHYPVHEHRLSLVGECHFTAYLDGTDDFPVFKGYGDFRSRLVIVNGIVIESGDGDGTHYALL